MNQFKSEAFHHYRKYYNGMLETLTDLLKEILNKFPGISFSKDISSCEIHTINLNREAQLRYGYDLKTDGGARFYITYRMEKYGMDIFPKYFFNFSLDTVIDNMYLFIISEMKQVILKRNYMLNPYHFQLLDTISNITTKERTDMYDHIIHEIVFLPDGAPVPSLPRYLEVPPLPRNVSIYE